MQLATERRAAPVGPVLAIAGGALLAVGSFLEWATVSVAVTGVDAETASTSGIDSSDGWVTLVAGAVAMLVGIVALRRPRRALAVLAIVAGLAGGALGVYDVVNAEDSVLDALAEETAAQAGLPADQVRAALDAARDAGELSLDISIGIGLIGVIAGGALAVVGGLLQMAGGGRVSSEATMGSTGERSVPAAAGAPPAPPAPSAPQVPAAASDPPPPAAPPPSSTSPPSP
jgi:hypothetical protein